MPIRKRTNVESFEESEVNNLVNDKQEGKIKKNRHWISILVVFLLGIGIGYIFTIKNNSNSLELTEHEDKNKQSEIVNEKNIKENDDYFEVQLENGETETISLSDLSDAIQQVDDSNKTFDINVPQFPINNNGLVYNSSKGGFILKFPSANISYSISSTDENFGRNDINCSRVINVIKYSEKENLEISPAVRIYECEGDILESWSPEIIIYPRVNKKFIVRMYDGAWYDFSVNLIFEKLNDDTIDVDPLKQITMGEAIKSLLNGKPLSNKTDVSFEYVSKTDELYPYFKTAMESWLIGTETDPNKLVSCETYITMKGILEGWNVGSYSKGNVKSVYWDKAESLGKLNGCQKGKYLTKGNL